MLCEHRCHCIEAAFIAAGALLLHGEKALLLDFQAHGDDDHVLALFKNGKHWGAISKSNSIWLRWRDPVYASPRELAMSYFHEYVNETHKTLRRISKPFDIGKYDPDYWLTSPENCWSMAQEIDASPHVDLISEAQARRLKLRDRFDTRQHNQEFTLAVDLHPQAYIRLNLLKIRIASWIARLISTGRGTPCVRSFAWLSGYDFGDTPAGTGLVQSR